MIDTFDALLPRYRARCAEDLAAFQKACAEHDEATLRHIVHKLAGLAPQFGQYETADAALAIDTALTRGETVTSETLETFEKLLRSQT